MKALISRTIASSFGKKIGRKIIVIESDDWGSIRMPSKKAYDNLTKAGINVKNCPYNTYDSLENENDIENLINFCKKFKDKNQKPLKITANFIMANPNFEKIKECNFTSYHYRDLIESYRYYQENDSTFKAIQKAINENIFAPQLHGREHLQANNWLSALKYGDTETLLAFDNGVWGHPSAYEKKSGINFSSAFHVTSNKELEFAKDSVADASTLFQKYFGFKSETFIAPRFIWPNEMEKTFYDCGIRALQGKIVQLKPTIGQDTKLRNIFNWMGKSNKNGLSYLIRNVFFEPTQKPNYNWEKDAIMRIETAFFWGKPAVISMHRLNFMGGFSEQNREISLKRLGTVITAIQKKFPDIEFLSSNELYSLTYAE
jgi:hypothetical protein